MSGPMDKLQALDKIEKEILTCLSSAGQALSELSKDKTSLKQIDLHTSNFLKTLNNVELEIAKHINYLTQVSTGHSHEGSSYASQKVLQMAWHRSSHARSRVNDLEKMRAEILAATAAQQQRQGQGQQLAIAPAPTGTTPSTTTTSSPSSVSAPTGQPGTITGTQQVPTPQTPSSMSH